MQRISARTGLAAAVVAAGAVAIAGAGAAHADSPTGSTNTSFAITAGGLSITTPATATLGSVAASPSSQTITGQLGSTSVYDLRTLALGWSVTVTGPASGSFQDSGSDTVPDGNATVWVANGDFSFTAAASPLRTRTDTHTSAANGVALSATAQNLLSVTATVTSNSATYNPSVQVTVPALQAVGTYSGTITQTVS